MKVPGWCEKCKKVKQVRVSGSGMVALASKHVATGICDACQDAEDQERREQLTRKGDHQKPNLGKSRKGR